MPIHKTLFPFEQAISNSLFNDYVNKNEKLKKFYSYSPDLASLKKGIKDISAIKFDRKALVEAITGQYTGANISRPSSVISLLEEKTYTVCTGHQLCLFTGPLYFIYKIISTINLTESLKKENPDSNFIPVYWMASEDHDFEEVNHVNIFGKKLEWKSEQKGAVGNFRTTELQALLTELKMIIGETENAKQLIKLFTDAYLGKKNLVDATRHLVNELFGEYGLVVIDGNDKTLKKQFAKFIADDIFEQKNFQLVNDSISELKTLGYNAQVNPREINVFYLSENARVRIEKSDPKYKSEIEEFPERFSPNVVLRPLYQQTILPNIAYVGGPGELSYWMEYKKMFDHHKVFFPALVPRSSILWIDKRSNEQMKKLGLSVEDLFKDTDAITKEYVEKNASEDLSLSVEEKELTLLFEKITKKVQAADASLKGAAEAEHQKLINSLKNLESKMLKAEKQKQETSVNQIKKLKEKLFPANGLQERHDNFIPVYLEQGKGFIAALKKEIDPQQLKFTVLQESK